MTLVSIEKLSTKPGKLVLTKAEILAALAPLHDLVKRIEETKARFDEWHETLPTVDNSGEANDGEIIGFVEDEDQVEFADCDLEIYDLVDGLRKDGYQPPYRAGDAVKLCRAMHDYPPIYNAVDARDAAERDAAKKKRAERAAATPHGQRSAQGGAHRREGSEHRRA
jgi:hypothetical protein